MWVCVCGGWVGVCVCVFVFVLLFVCLFGCLFLSSLTNLLGDACIVFRNGVDNLEIEHKTC